MFRTTALLVALMTLIALGVGVKQGIFGGSDRAALREAGNLVVGASAPATSRTDPATSSLDLPPTHMAGSATSDQSPEFSIHPSGDKPNYQTVIPQRNDGGELQTPASVDTEAQNPAAAIGRPFPVSASVEESCTRRSKNGGDELCDEVHRTLAEMAQEPRNPAWAADMEAKLRDYVVAAEPGKFSIRSIECRTSVCAVEVESLYGPYGKVYDFDALFPGVVLHGYETDQYGAKVTVTVTTFTRHKPRL